MKNTFLLYDEWVDDKMTLAHIGPARCNKSKDNLTLLGNRGDLTGVEALVEVSVSDSLTWDVPGPGWWRGGYDQDERYHRQIGKTISTAWNPLHMVLCPLILSLPFHFECLGRAGQLSVWGRLFSLLEQSCHHQSSNARRTQSSNNNRPVSAQLAGFSTTVGISWATRSSLSLTRQYACPGSVMSARRLDGTRLGSSLNSLSNHTALSLCCLPVITQAKSNNCL